MIRAIHATQVRASFYIELLTSSAPEYVEVEYDRSTDDTPDVITFRPSFEVSGDRVRFSAFILTNKPWRVRIPGDARTVDMVSEAYDIAIQVGRDSGGIFIQAPGIMIVEKLSVDVFLPMGEYIEHPEHGLTYHTRLRGSDAGSRVYVDGLPPLPVGRYVLFEVSGIEILGAEGTQDSYGIYRREE